MRQALVCLLFIAAPAAGQGLHADDPEGDVDTPVPGTMAFYDIQDLSICTPTDCDHIDGGVAWGIGFHGGSFDVVGSQTAWVVRLHWMRDGTPHVVEHDTYCLSMPPACATGWADISDPCGVAFWAESVWRSPTGERQMDRIPDAGEVAWECSAGAPVVTTAPGSPDGPPADSDEAPSTTVETTGLAPSWALGIALLAGWRARRH